MKPTSRQFFTNQRGLILLPIVLVMVISLGAGVAIAYRVVSTTHQSAILTESDQAYHCAEAGVEEALGKLKGGDDTGGSGELEDVSGGQVCTFRYTVDGLDAGAEPLDFPLEKDAVYQVDLEGYSGSLEIYWGKGNENAENAENAALVVAVVKGSAGSYTMEKYAVNCGETASTGNGFDSPSPGSGDYPCGLGTLNFSGDSPLLRIRTLYNGTGVRVEPLGDGFPNQGYRITSIGEAGESQRIVVVTRSHPALPAIFDYVLFSGSETKALEK